MASGYRAYEINGTRYDSLTDVSHADHVIISALLFEHGVPGPSDEPEVLSVRYDPVAVCPRVRDTRLSHSDLVNVFNADTRQRILDDGDPMPPEVCNRLLGTLLLKTYGEHIEPSTRFLLKSTIESSEPDGFARFIQAIDEGDVDLGPVTVMPFSGTYLLVDETAGSSSIYVQSVPYSPAVPQSRSSDGSPPSSLSEPADTAASQAESKGATTANHDRSKRSARKQELSRDAAEGTRSEPLNVEDPTNIATGTDVDPEAEHIPDDVARDIERLRASVDEEHDFGASYDFTPSTIGRPTDTADITEAGRTGSDPFNERDVQSDSSRIDDREDVTEGVASEVATSSVDYTFGPLRSIEDDLGVSSDYRFGPPRSLEDDLGAGVSRTWAQTMEKVAHVADTSATFSTPTYDMDVVEYDFDTSDLYDFTPPEYDEPDTVSRTTEEAIETDALETDALEEAAPASRGRAPTDNPSGDQTSDASTSTSTGDRPALFSDDVVAVGSRVMGVSTDLNGRSVKRTNEGVTIGCIARLFAIICVLTGLAYLVLAI